MSGHTVHRCYKIHGYPANSRTERKQGHTAQFGGEETTNTTNDGAVSFTVAQYQQILQLIGKESITNDSNNTGSIDMAGKFCNMAGQFSFTSSSGTNWIVDSGATDHMCCDISLFTSHDIVHTPSSYITIPNGKQVQIAHTGTVNRSNDIVLKNVLYVPDFKFNLVSIPKICKDMACSVTFNDNCFLQGPSMRPQHLGSFKNGLYYLEDDQHHRRGDNTSTTVTEEYTAATNMVCNISVIIVNKTKLWHLRFGHLPVSMLSHVTSIFGQEKCNLDGICQICPISRHTRSPFHSSTRELKNFYQKQGILHQKTCVYTPQQNGVVERKHRHLLETVPPQIWGECVLCATHLINRMPLSLPGIFDMHSSNIEPHNHTSSNSSGHSISPPPPTRKSTRVTKPPTIYNEFADVLVELRTYTKASQDPRWVAALDKELEALHANHTWNLVQLPPGKKAIGCKWVYKIKMREDGTIERFKARLVAKGFNQKWGIDFLETFSPVVKMNTIRCLIDVAAHRKWFLSQLDVNNAFLHGDLCEEVYIKSRKHTKNGKMIILAVYVDDIILIGDDDKGIQDIKMHLNDIFSIKDLGSLSYFLGIEVGYVNDGITLAQRKFTKDLLSEAGIEICKSVATPLPINLKLDADEGEVFEDPTFYSA
ncbi:uncharacterized protein LOC141680498 [Apium graveolens]|uniref:uncharacterized protein LOC141680498 n=1 Tax=Apium graveolens TaxID=4045 RepID=UPI003D7B520E